MPSVPPSSWQLARTGAMPPHSTSRRQFFLEESMPAGARNLRHVYPPVEKLGEIMTGDQPWETGNVSTFCGSIVRFDDGRLRIYYTSFPIGFKSMYVAVAESEDGGLTWAKPRLGQREIDGHNTNIIHFENFSEPQGFQGQPQVLRLPDGRWRMYYWHHGQGNYRYMIAHSEDGLRWRLDDPPRYALVGNWVLGKGGLRDGYEPGTFEGEADWSADRIAEQWRLKSMRTNDASFVYYNDQFNRFEYYAQIMVPAIPDRRVEVDNAPMWHRYIQRRFSEDGITFSAPEMIIRPDAKDPWDLQFYHLAVQWHEDWMVGSLGHYRVEDGQQTQDLELAFSRDGRTWHRPARGGLIPREPGATDQEGIYPPNAWIDEGDTWLCLYTGTPLKHNQATRADTTKRTAGMGARWPKHRLVGLGAGRLVGSFLSEPFYPQQDAITLDADIRGELRAELCDVHGRKHEGCHLMDTVPVIGDSGAHELRWKRGGTRGYQWDAVRLRFEWTRGEVYGIGF